MRSELNSVGRPHRNATVSSRIWRAGGGSSQGPRDVMVPMPASLTGWFAGSASSWWEDVAKLLCWRRPDRNHCGHTMPDWEQAAITHRMQRRFHQYNVDQRVRQSRFVGEAASNALALLSCEPLPGGFLSGCERNRPVNFSACVNPRDREFWAEIVGVRKEPPRFLSGPGRSPSKRDGRAVGGIDVNPCGITR